jgi:hypothetical protein
VLLSHLEIVHNAEITAADVAQRGSDVIDGVSVGLCVQLLPVDDAAGRGIRSGECPAAVGSIYWIGRRRITIRAGLGVGPGAEHGETPVEMRVIQAIAEYGGIFALIQGVEFPGGRPVTSFQAAQSWSSSLPSRRVSA